MTMAYTVNFPVKYFYTAGIPDWLALPQFWLHRPRAYFSAAEQAFATCNITDSQTKYDHVLSNFPSEKFLDIQYEVYWASTGNTPYEDLKASLISLYGNKESYCIAIPTPAAIPMRPPAASTPTSPEDRQPQVTLDPSGLTSHPPTSPAASTPTSTEARQLQVTANPSCPTNNPQPTPAASTQASTEVTQPQVTTHHSGPANQPPATSAASTPTSPEDRQLQVTNPSGPTNHPPAIPVASTPISPEDRQLQLTTNP